MRYVVEGADGSRVEVEAVDWMMAMAKAIADLGLEVSGWACQTRPDGSVVVVDPMSGRSWNVHAAGPSSLESGVIEGRTVAPSAPDSAHDLVAHTTPPPDEVEPPDAAPDATPTPSPLRPTPSRRPRPAARPSRPTTKRPTTGPSPLDPKPQPFRGARAPTLPPSPAPPAQPAAEAPAATSSDGAPEDLAERLFDLSMELSGANDGHDACRRALDLCLQLIPCEAGSVLRGGLNDAHLTFVAVAGPAAQKLLNQRLPFGAGIVGASFDLGITIGVDDVGEDPRHASEFDQQTGFRTRSVLCVPVQGRDQYHGAIQLLNPLSGRFVTWHRDAVEQLASSLATTLDGL